MNNDITFCNPQYVCKQCNDCKRNIKNIKNNKDCRFCSVADFSILIGFSKECKFMKGEK